MDIYVLTEYEYNTFSYDGIIPREDTYFLTEELAREYAKKHNLNIVNYVKNPETEAELSKARVVTGDAE